MTHGRRVARRTPGTTLLAVARPLPRLTVLCLVLAGLVVLTGWTPFAPDRAGLVSAPQVNLARLPASTTHTRAPPAASDPAAARPAAPAPITTTSTRSVGSLSIRWRRASHVPGS